MTGSAVHGFLPGRSAFTAADFSGGAATVGRLLANLGFEVRTDAGTTLTTTQLLDKIAGLRPYQSPDGHTAAYQPITLLWAIGRHWEPPSLRARYGCPDDGGPVNGRCRTAAPFPSMWA